MEKIDILKDFLKNTYKEKIKQKGKKYKILFNNIVVEFTFKKISHNAIRFVFIKKRKFYNAITDRNVEYFDEFLEKIKINIKKEYSIQLNKVIREKKNAKIREIFKLELLAITEQFLGIIPYRTIYDGIRIQNEKGYFQINKSINKKVLEHKDCYKLKTELDLTKEDYIKFLNFIKAIHINDNVVKSI